MMYFGYGSLVNRQTVDVSEISLKATLNGWERQWAHRAERPWTEQGRAGPGVCALTITPATDCQIDGVLAEVADRDIDALDRREQGYDRVMLPTSDFIVDHKLPAEPICVYVSSASHCGWANPDYPILQSYIDCVLAGFSQQYGHHGARRFMASTRGWSKPILNDRHSPLYPRAVNLEPEEKSLIELLLDATLKKSPK